MFTKILLDLSIRKKLLSGFGLILIITLAIAWIGQQSLTTTLKRINTLRSVSNIDASLTHARQQEKNYLLRDDKKYLQEAITL
jgi:methyl-accepting chemotaxis protein